MGMALNGATGMAGDATNTIAIQEQTIEGEQAVVLENAYYKAILLPQRATLPLTFFYKPGGKDLLVRRKTIQDGIASRDGLMDCLPWVGDSSRKQQDKGLLHTAQWQVRCEQKADEAVFTGQTEIHYRDPANDQPADLRFSKTIAGSSRHAQLRMDYEVSNIGKTEARLMLVAHPRITAGGAYRKGDYVFVPGTNCWIGQFQWFSLAKEGARPFSWISWPREDIINYEPKTGAQAKGDYVYAFVPANWAVIGNDASKEFILFQCSPLKVGTKTQDMPFFCVLHRDGDYLLEMCVSRELDAANWSQPGATLSLKPGEKLAFTLTLTPGRGLDQKKIRSITRIDHDQVVLKSDPQGDERIFKLAE